MNGSALPNIRVLSASFRFSGRLRKGPIGSRSNDHRRVSDWLAAMGRGRIGVVVDESLALLEPLLDAGWNDFFACGAAADENEDW